MTDTISRHLHLDHHWSVLVATGLLVLAGLLYLKRHLKQASRFAPTDRDGTKKAVAITGCDTGFGNLLTKELDRLGFQVFSGCFTEEGKKKLDSETSDNVHTHVLDVTKNDSSEKFFEFVEKNTTRGLWGVVANAGIGIGGDIDLTSLETYFAVSSVNYEGVVRTVKHALPLLKKRRGRIVNVASIAGEIGAPGMGAYCGSKFAVEGFSDSIRRELSRFGMCVSVIEPGFHNTPIVQGAKSNFHASRFTKEQREEYGEKFFKYRERAVARLPSISADPMNVVNEMVHALTSKLPKTRYVIGRDARAIMILKKFPDYFQDWVLSFQGGPPPAITTTPEFWKAYD